MHVPLYNVPRNDEISLMDRIILIKDTVLWIVCTYIQLLYIYVVAYIVYDQNSISKQNLPKIIDIPRNSLNITLYYTKYVFG